MKLYWFCWVGLRNIVLVLLNLFDEIVLVLLGGFEEYCIGFVEFV